MSQREWVQFVKDCKVPIPITEINDVFRRVDRAEKEVCLRAREPHPNSPHAHTHAHAQTPSRAPSSPQAKAKDPKAKADKQMVLAEFVEALVRTAGKLMNTSKAGKQALKDGQLGEGFTKLVNTYILPLAVRARPRT